MKSQAIIIPGGYRSGTTALCAALDEAGVYSGDWLNTQWESADIYGWTTVQLNHANKRNEKWSEVVPHDYMPDPEFVARLRGFRERMDNCGSSHYFIKDPQIARILPAFAAVWPDAQYIVSDREVAQTLYSQRDRERIGKIHLGHIRSRNCYMNNIWYWITKAKLKYHVVGHAAMSTPDSAKLEEMALNQYLGFGVPLIKNWKHNINARSVEDILSAQQVASYQQTACTSPQQGVTEAVEETEGRTSEDGQEAQSPTSPLSYDV